MFILVLLQNVLLSEFSSLSIQNVNFLLKIIPIDLTNLLNYSHIHQMLNRHGFILCKISMNVI